MVGIIPRTLVRDTGKTLINITAARAVYREFMYIEKYVIYGILGFLDFGGHFWILYGIPEVQEAFRNLPGARGFALTKYQPIPSHGDPIHAQN